MNILQKLSYRIFQEAFHLVIPFLPYREPEILDSCTDLSKVFKKENISSLLIVTDKGIESNGLLKLVEDICKLCNINYVVYDGLKPNPTVKNVENGLELFKKNKSQAIIAIGGGTIIDISKFLILDYEGTIDQVILHEIPYKKAKKLYVVPTTCGTGSEVTNVAISELKKRKTKKGLADDLIYPDKALLIPEMVETLPYKFFATSSIDALIHSVESYLSPNSTLYSRMFSVKAMTMILNGFKKVVRDGRENWSQYAKDFLVASNLAGIAFGNAGCAAVHALSYPLGGAYHIPHGEANQLMFESVYNKYYEKDPNGRIQDFFEVVSEILGVEKNDALKALFALTNQILERKPLSSYGIKKEELSEFVKSVIEGQQRLLNNNYVELSGEDMLEIYENVYDK